MSLATLLAAVYADPASDAPRAVYADALVEAGDPLGELIQLQLGARRGAKKRAREIFDPTWWRGRHPVGSILGAVRFEDIERGFPVRFNPPSPAEPAEWAPFVDAAGWSTLTRWSVYDDHPVGAEILASASLPVLEELSCNGPHVAGVVAGLCAPRLERLQVSGGVSANRLGDLAKLPALRQVSFRGDSDTLIADAFAALAALPTSVERVQLGRVNGYVTLSRAGALAIYTGAVALPALADELAALSPRAIRELQVVFAEGFHLDRRRAATQIREVTARFKKKTLHLG